MKLTKFRLKQIIKEELSSSTNREPDTGKVNFEWSDSGLTMKMLVGGNIIMSFSRQEEVKQLIAQLQGVLDGPMRTSP